ncbi:MAG TPA: hypothetical protein VHE12_05350 [bacterium]|nr:hypothetical protein [bacterium]
MRPFSLMRAGSLLLLLTLGPFLPAARGATPSPNGPIQGWGTEKFDGPDDLPRAIQASQDKARQDLSANILTYVKNVTIDKTVEENGKTREFFKRITVTRVVQLLREVDLSRPQVDQADHLVTTQASVSRPVAQRIIQDALAKIRQKEAEYNDNMARLRMLTDGGKYYYKKKVETVEDMDDVEHMTAAMEELKEELIHEKLRDIQDVRNAITTRFLKEFPRDDKVTYLAYIGIDQYKAIINNYDKEVYGQVSPSYIGGAYNKEADPWNMPNVAEAVLPGKAFSNIGWGYRWLYYTGVDPVFGCSLYGRYSYEKDIWGLSASLGLGIDLGGNQITANSPYKDLGWDTYGFHIPVEVDAHLYLRTVKSDAHIPFLKVGLVGEWSVIDAKDPDSGKTYDLVSGFSGGFVFGGGFTIFHKSGMFLQTMDFGLDCQWIPNGLYNEGSQYGIGFFCNWGIT